MHRFSDEAIPPQFIDDALEHVLASRGFRGAARKRRFLQFIVQETLAGRADRIKAYTIAMDVFDRDASFDPLLDPVVRIQAGRVRRCLEQYYLTEGAADPLQITIPKGSYVPHFIWKSGAGMAELPEISGEATERDNVVRTVPTVDDEVPEEPASTLPLLPSSGERIVETTKSQSVVLVTLVLVAIFALTLVAVSGSFLVQPSPTEEGRTITAREPSLMVLPFVNGTGNPAHDVFTEEFTEDLIGALIRFKNTLVFGADTRFRPRSEPTLLDALPATKESDTHISYVLKGSVTQVGDEIQVNVALINAKDSRYIWSDSFRRVFNPQDMIDMRKDIAIQVARALAQPDGVIDKEEMRLIAMRSPATYSSYECLLLTRQYWRQLNLKLHGQVLTCLERVTQTDPHYADAWAALSMVYIDEARLGFNPTSARPDPVAVGLQLATHAVTIAPDNSLPFQALGLAYWLHREPQLSIVAYERALFLNPNDNDILADLGRCYSFLGNWEKGIPLIEDAYARNPARPGWHRIVLALYHYVHGRYDEALTEARKVNLPDVVLSHVALAMIYGQTGDMANAGLEVQEILRLDPKFEEKAVSEFERRNIDPAIIAKMIDGLQKAGLGVLPRPAVTEDR